MNYARMHTYMDICMCVSLSRDAAHNAWTELEISRTNYKMRNAVIWSDDVISVLSVSCMVLGI